ncbi:iron export ABC transporter permease subunit FetB [Telmatospirillum sp. J64-1]|uniref:ABC transporter permease n=1 Tax=Telmatospirillum sp. J64-1 TaxID=2502183 RepID=UPI00115EF968|nr:iron export ABC transporter permease subunit FetB [Telmatospirillum sp. J64-1]
MDYIALDWRDLAVASLLVMANAGLSLWLKLGIERRLLIAALRSAVQLVLVGLVLTTLFRLSSPLWTGLAALVMILLAGREIMARQDRRFTGWWSYGLGTVCIMTAASVVTVFALTTQVRPDPWFDPRYALPMLGMILGSTMTGISLGLHSLTKGAIQGRQAIEAQLALGATRSEAMRPILREALRSALMPVINSMSATGIVALPGMMTGQILAGVEPVEAVKYQILIMFLIAGGTALGAVMAVLGGLRRLSDSRHRLRLDRLRAD